MTLPQSSDSENAGRALFDQLIDAWNRRDAGGFAQCFTPDGSLVGFDGTQMDEARQEGQSASYAVPMP